MNNNINDNKTKSIFDSVLFKRIYLKYNQQNQQSKEKENQYVQSLIQGYIKKYIGARIKLGRIWLCMKVCFNDNKKGNKYNNDEETNDSFDNLINLFTVPKDISKEIVNFLKKYDKYVEIADESKEEYLIDLTSYIINNKEKYFKNGIKPFLQELKIQMEQKFNIKIYIGKGNNILLASLACLKCFMESVEKNDDSIIINDIKNLFEDNTDKLYYLIEVENDEKSILSFLNEFPLEYLSNSENKYFENFNKMINNKNFIDIKTFGDIININYQEIYKIFNKENLYKEIFLFCLGIGDAFHKSQIITNNEKNLNEIKEEIFKNKNKTQLIKIYIQLANKLFKQIFFYHYNPLTLVIILKTRKNKLYKRVVDKETLFNTYDGIIITGTKIIEQICDNLTENEINDFNKMTIYFDNIVKLDTIDRKIWEELYENEINEIRIKSNKICFWNNFLNSKSKDEEKMQSKSFDNNSANKSIKETDKKKRTILTSKSINEINKFSKKANLDLLGFNKKRKSSKGKKLTNYFLLAKNNKLEKFGIISKEQK